jgi:hypothetical protein
LQALLSDAIDLLAAIGAALDVPGPSDATAGLADGIDVKVMSERLGRANVAITPDLYQHVLKEMDESAATTVAAVILGSGERDGGVALDRASVAEWQTRRV